MKKLNKIFTYWRDDLFGSKAVPDYRREKNLANLYNQEKNLLQQKKEEKVFKPIDFKECGCLPDCGCKDTYKPDDTQITVFDT